MKEAKKNRKNKKVSSKPAVLIRSAILIIVILVLLFFAAQSIGDLTLSGLSDGIKGYIKGFRQGGGYPYSIASEEIKSIKPMGSGLMILAQGSTTFIDSTAKLVNREEHTYSNPQISINSGKCVLYDRMGKSLKVRTRTETRRELTTQHEILKCDIAANGNLAVATLSKESSSMLTVYDRNFKELFVWKSPSQHIIDVALSDNGKHVAAAVMGAKDGDILCVVYIFDINKPEPVSSFEYPQTVIADIQFRGNSTVTVTGDNIFSTIKNRSKRADDESFNFGELISFDKSEDGKSAILLSNYGSMNSTVLNVYGKNAAKSFSLDFNENIRSVSCDKGHIGILTDKNLFAYNHKGKKVFEVNTENGEGQIILNGRHIYVVGGGIIRQYSL